MLQIKLFIFFTVTIKPVKENNFDCKKDQHCLYVISEQARN